MTRFMLFTGVLLGACTVPSGKSLSELKAKQATSVCEEYAERTIVCGDELSEETFRFGGDCGNAGAPASCTATVGDYRACQEAVELLSDEDFCATEGGPEDCYALLQEDCVFTD